MTLGRMDENLQKRPGRGIDDIVDIPGHKQQDHEENRSGHCANANTGNHNFGPFTTRIGNFYSVSLECLVGSYIHTFYHMGY